MAKLAPGRRHSIRATGPRRVARSIPLHQATNGWGRAKLRRGVQKPAKHLHRHGKQQGLPASHIHDFRMNEDVFHQIDPRQRTLALPGGLHGQNLPPVARPKAQPPARLWPRPRPAQFQSPPHR